MEILVALKYTSAVVLGLLPIINPLSTVPIFLALTSNMPADVRQQQARKACIYAFAILIAFLYASNAIIALFGISLAGIRVAGGLIILVLSFRMLFSGEDDASRVADDVEEVRRAHVDISFTPLAMPAISGPGSIAVIISYASQIPDDQQVAGYLVITLATLITVAITYVVLFFSGRIARFLGEQGIHALTKIMGFLIACIAIQFIASGIKEFATT